MSRPSIPTRNPRVVYRELASGEGVLLHLDSGAYHGLNTTGSAIWALVDGRRDEHSIVAEFRAVLDGDIPDGMDVTVSTFLSDLRTRDLIR